MKRRSLLAAAATATLFLAAAAPLCADDTANLPPPPPPDAAPSAEQSAEQGQTMLKGQAVAGQPGTAPPPVEGQTVNAPGAVAQRGEQGQTMLTQPMDGGDRGNGMERGQDREEGQTLFEGPGREGSQADAPPPPPPNEPANTGPFSYALLPPRHHPVELTPAEIAATHAPALTPEGRVAKLRVLYAALLQRFDTAHAGSLNAAQQAEAIGFLQTHRPRIYALILKRFDRNGDGVLQPDETAAFFRVLSELPPPP